MRKLIIGLLMLISYAGIAQDKQVFVATQVTHMKYNEKTKDWDIVGKKTGYISITYGKNYMQIGEDPKARFTLFGDVVNHEDDAAMYVMQAGYDYQGRRITTSTMYGKKKTFIKVGIDLKTDLFVYTLQGSEE